MIQNPYASGPFSWPLSPPSYHLVYKFQSKEVYSFIHVGRDHN